MAQHVHIHNIRPDAVYKTGVITAYPVSADPVEVARKTVGHFLSVVRPAGSEIAQNPQPEEVAMRAKRIADAMAAGIQPPVGTNPKLIEAAKMMMAGRSMIIRSAGRAVRVTGK